MIAESSLNFTERADALGFAASAGRAVPSKTGGFTAADLVAGFGSDAALALSLGVAAALSRLTRSAMLEVTGADFIRAARARGVSSSGLDLGHALKNALIPVITLLGTQFGNLLSGTVIIERIFNVPGLGNLLFEAVANRDYTVIQAAVLT